MKENKSSYKQSKELLEFIKFLEKNSIIVHSGKINNYNLEEK